MIRRPSSPKASPPMANPLVRLADSSEHVRCFVHLRDDRVFSGIFNSITGVAYPRWALHRDPGYFPEESVYLRMPSGRGAIAVIAPLKHNIHINDDIPEHHRFWLLLSSGTLLSANLRRYNYERLPDNDKARCFVRIPDERTVYVGEVDYNLGRRPSWLM